MEYSLFPPLVTLIAALASFWSPVMAGQMPAAPPPDQNVEISDPGIPSRWCAGEFPTNLTVHNCVYRQRQRVEDWLGTSVTDQAVTTSALSALWGSAIRSPKEWPGTAQGFAYRLRASYVGGLENGTTQFLVSSAFHLDQSHISCAEDPLNQLGIQKARAGQTATLCEGRYSLFRRSGHIVLDTLTARVSKPEPGSSMRVPSPRLLGAFAGAYGQSPFEPGGENTFAAILTRSGMSLVTPLLGSILHEYPSVLNALTKPFHPSKKLPPAIRPLDLSAESWEVAR